MGLLGILRNSDIDGGGGVGWGVVLASSASAWGRSALKVIKYSMGVDMAGNVKGDKNYNDYNSDNAPPTSSGSALVRKRTRSKPTAENIWGYFASPGGVVKKKAPKSKSPLVDLTLDIMDMGNYQEVGDIVSATGGKDR